MVPRECTHRRQKDAKVGGAQIYGSIVVGCKAHQACEAC